MSRSSVLGARPLGGGGCRSTSTPIATSIGAASRSTSTPIAACAHGGDRSMSTPHVASTCGSMSTRYSRSTLHSAFTGGGDCSSLVDASTSTSYVMSLSACEIAQLRCLLDDWDSSPTVSAGSVTDSSDIEKPLPTHSAESESNYKPKGVASPPLGPMSLVRPRE
ncbi:hypothetical protein TRIUR3_13155 [Triticum urartu]|uniref:Uncharacterized protein n=1 Tax=Triticum urartu TaxID=4572 RepID=M8A4Z8_TRIUA|nr:hypothetical protein TRIUR3_13155 [Triticum urartu]